MMNFSNNSYSAVPKLDVQAAARSFDTKFSASGSALWTAIVFLAVWKTSSLPWYLIWEELLTSELSY